MSIKSWLEKNEIEMYFRQGEGKSVVAERFIRTLNNKILNTCFNYQKICTLMN